ncbi:UNVERIFIED_CONTAM: hypothetical protein K2H54_062098 [Gekko kuhli]
MTTISGKWDFCSCQLPPVDTKNMATLWSRSQPNGNICTEERMSPVSPNLLSQNPLGFCSSTRIFIEEGAASYMLPLPKQNKNTKGQKTNTEKYHALHTNVFGMPIN